MTGAIQVQSCCFMKVLAAGNTAFTERQTGRLRLAAVTVSLARSGALEVVEGESIFSLK